MTDASWIPDPREDRDESVADRTHSQPSINGSMTGCSVCEDTNMCLCVCVCVFVCVCVRVSIHVRVTGFLDIVVLEFFFYF